ncbi:hypothetical protein GGG16DRAFT_113807 [Schizophyllum commune]
MTTPLNTRSGRTVVPSTRLATSLATADAINTADGVHKRKAPAKAPAPRIQRSAGSGAVSAPAIARMQLDKVQVAAVLAHKAAADKRASVASSARRQSAKVAKTAPTSASAKAAATAQKAADVQARLDAALREDAVGSDADVDDTSLHTTKKRRVDVVDLFEDDDDIFADMPELLPVSDDEGSNGQSHSTLAVFGSNGNESDSDHEDTGDNGMQVLSLDPVTPSARRTRRGKVAQSDFTPRTAKLANAAKVQARTRTATQDAFPAEASAAAFLDISRAVERASGPDAVTFRDAFDRLQINLTAQEDIFTYVGYASSGLRGEVSAKVKELFALMTGIPGKLSVDEIIDVVKWLLSDSNYMYGDLDIKARTVNRNLPFHSVFLKPVIKSVCFGRGKANQDAARTMISHREISVSLYALVGAAIENMLKAWQAGALSTNFSFTEEAARQSYLRHRASFMILQSAAPNFTHKMQFSLLHSILSDTGRVHLLDGYLAPEQGHLKGVDYEALEASVESGEEYDV